MELLGSFLYGHCIAVALFLLWAIPGFTSYALLRCERAIPQRIAVVMSVFWPVFLVILLYNLFRSTR